MRGPSTWAAQDAPVALDDRLSALVEEQVADSDEGRRTAVRHRLARRLLDDPVVYIDRLGPDERAYFVNQRGPMAARLCEATGLVPESRAEGLALVDEAGWLTDVAMPAEGTEAHATLLVADVLARGFRQPRPNGAGGAPAPAAAVRMADIVDFLREAKGRFGKYWRKSARAPGAEAELAETAVERLEKLHLIERHADAVRPLPALARFALGEAEVRSPAGAAHRCAARGGCRAGADMMDTPLFACEPGKGPRRPDLPVPTRERWQPLRLGLVELFHYDSEEFWFRDGHLLLRGNNGTGKSKVLSLTLPFLLDAQLKPSRIEPDGDSGKKMAGTC